MYNTDRDTKNQFYMYVFVILKYRQATCEPGKKGGGQNSANSLAHFSVDEILIGSSS